eukprot:2734080-Rhodomonas_salina.2
MALREAVGGKPGPLQPTQQAHRTLLRCQHLIFVSINPLNIPPEPGPAASSLSAMLSCSRQVRSAALCCGAARAGMSLASE